MPQLKRSVDGVKNITSLFRRGEKEGRGILLGKTGEVKLESILITITCNRERKRKLLIRGEYECKGFYSHGGGGRKEEKGGGEEGE